MSQDKFTNQASSQPARQAEQPGSYQKEEEDLDDEPPLAMNNLPTTRYSSLISEIAGKFGCADDLQQRWSDADEGLEYRGESSKSFLPPQWQSVRDSFRSALDAALRTVEARTALQSQIESLQSTEKF